EGKPLFPQREQVAVREEVEDPTRAGEALATQIVQQTGAVSGLRRGRVRVATDQPNQLERAGRLPPAPPSLTPQALPAEGRAGPAVNSRSAAMSKTARR